MGLSKKGFHDVTRINIISLPQVFSDQDFYKTFRSCGSIEFCQMVTDYETGIKSGMVNYSRSNSAKKAIRMCERRRFKVSYAISSRPKSDIQFEFRDGPKSRNDSECKVVVSSAGKSDEVPSVEEIPVVNEAKDDTMKGGLCHMFQQHLNSSRGGSGGHWRDRIPSSLRIGSSNNRWMSCSPAINKYCYKYFMEVTRKEKNIGTISSSELLKRIKDKRREEGILEKDHVDDCEHPASGHRDNLDLEEGELPHSTSESDFSPLEIHIDLLADIRDFISTFYGGVSTVDIMARFERLPLSQPSICTDLLNEICDFRRNVYGEGMWYLKPEFRI